jgi:hypothetical protein
MGNSLDQLWSMVAHFGVKKPDLTGLLNTSLRHLGQWKWLWATLSGSGLAKPIKNAKVVGSPFLVILYLHLLTIK